ncbi:MAG: 6-phosphofructokinase, partial [Planctomycetota bacterium]
MSRLAVLTSGGDAPGMNPAIRGVATAARGKGAEVLGVRNGFRGLVEGDWAVL